MTSLSFDISVLELFWTLARGFTVVVHGDGAQREPSVASATRSPPRAADRLQPVLLRQRRGRPRRRPSTACCSRARSFADAHGFAAVWTPERHFHAFGGLYPNPSVTSAAIAAVTQRVAIRAGSVVLPLHHPVRVAEEWAVVDNLSNGRVGLSFASGWQPNDFVLQPGSFANAKHGMMVATSRRVRRLWRGESASSFPGPTGQATCSSRTLPRPVQPELPVWVTAAGNPETFGWRARPGASVLTHLLGQTLEELAEKIERLPAARGARAATARAAVGSR